MATRSGKTTGDQGARAPDAGDAPEVPDGDTQLDRDEIQALLEFDPFADGEGAPSAPEAGEGDPPVNAPPGEGAPEGADGVQAGAGEGEGADDVPAVQPDTTPPAGEPPAAPEPSGPDVPQVQAPDPRDAQISALTEQLKQQGELLRNLTQAQQAPPAAPAAPSTEPPQEDIPSYEFEVPDQLVEGLGAEEPMQRKMAVTALIKGVGQAIHRTVMGTLQERMRTEVQEQVSSTVASQSSNQNIYNDFYEAFPQLKNDTYRPFVQSAVTEVIKENGGQDTWTPLLRDAIGQRALQRIQEAVGQFAQGQPPPQPPQPNPNPVPPQPPRQLRGGSRPAPRDPGGSVSDQVADLLRL